MDAFTKNFFPSFNTPGVDFVYDETPATWCYSRGIISVDNDGINRNQRKTIYQPMTPLGFLNVRLEGMGSIYDGISKNYLTADGQINFHAISDTMKQQAGRSTSEVSMYIGLAQAMRWDDNHVPLLFNMLRYTILTKMRETCGNLNGRLGDFVEDTLRINMDQWWTDEYPAEAAFTEWPCKPVNVDDGHGGAEPTYTAAHRIESYYDEAPNPAVDLRGLSSKQALFVLIMLNAWTRSSRFKLDASLPRLTDTILYRHSDDLSVAYEGWASGHPTPMLTSQEAWAALRQYVTINRLYDHFSAALFLVSSLTYQFVPETAEGTAWLGINWLAVIPAFHSVRGRLPFFNSGEPAFLNVRPLDEFNFIGNRLEKINLIALTFSQAFYTGIAVRGLRKCFELEPDDLFQTEVDFYNPENFVSAAASEFTRVAAPLSGMAGIYITANMRFEDVHSARQVLTRNQTTAEVPPTHTYGVQTFRRIQTGFEVVDPHTLPDTDPAKAELIKQMNILSIGAKAIRASMPDWVPEPAQALALTGQIRRPITAGVDEQFKTVMVPVLPHPGYPVFLTPVQSFPYSTPFMEHGIVDASSGKPTMRGNEFRLPVAWQVISLLTSLGYGSEYDIRGDILGARRFLVGRHSKQVWPVLYEPEHGDDPVILRRVIEGDGVTIDLPPLHNKFIKQHVVTFKYHVQRRGVCAGPNNNIMDVAEFGGHVPITRKPTSVVFQLDESSKLVRGFIHRQETVFRYAPVVQVGVIPPGSSADAADAGENSTGGGNKHSESFEANPSG